MAVVSDCKRCGSGLVNTAGGFVCECPACGFVQTLPASGDENTVASYNRANRMRMELDFDGAASAYKKLTEDFPGDAESYWGLCLSSYGVVYPEGDEKQPAVHRACPVRFSRDENYLSAIDNADASALVFYRDGAREIDRVREEILSLARKIEPCDIYVCSVAGSDGVLSEDAGEICDALKNWGYKVFTSVCSLEGKSSPESEAAVCSALESARIMLVAGSSPEEFNSPAVKNELSRFVKLADENKGKTIIPCLRSADEGSLPAALTGLKIHNTDKPGFIRELIKRIDAIFENSSALSSDSAEEPVKKPVPSEKPSGSAYVDRAFLFLEDGRWADADAYAEKALDSDPRSAEAYLVKLMCALRVTNREKLAGQKTSFESAEYCQKALRFAGNALKAELEGYIRAIKDATEAKKRQDEEAYSAGAAKIKDAVEANLIRLKMEALGREISENEKEAAGVEIIISNYSEVCTSLWEINKNLNDLNDRIQQLQSARAVSVKTDVTGRQEIDAELAFLKGEVNKNTARFYELRGGLGGFATKDEAVKKLQLLKQRAEGLAAQKTDIPETEISFAEAKNLLHTDSGLQKYFMLKYPKEFFSSVERGETVSFGSHNGNTEWLVLDKQEDSLFVISKNAVDFRPFNDVFADVAWEGSSLRKWLNSEFFASAFSEDEQKLIKSVVTSDTAARGGYPASTVQDRVFLLSSNQFNNCLFREARVCAAAMPVQGQGVPAPYVPQLCWWWLRTSGSYRNNEAFVTPEGGIYSRGNPVNRPDGGVRPAMWIELK